MSIRVGGDPTLVARGAVSTITGRFDDFGEGMNEEIIDGQLTRLFSSSKDGDLTKRGKFGDVTNVIQLV